MYGGGSESKSASNISMSRCMFTLRASRSLVPLKNPVAVQQRIQLLIGKQQMVFSEEEAIFFRCCFQLNILIKDFVFLPQFFDKTHLFQTPPLQFNYYSTLLHSPFPHFHSSPTVFTNFKGGVCMTYDSVLLTVASHVSCPNERNLLKL